MNPLIPSTSNSRNTPLHSFNTLPSLPALFSLTLSFPHHFFLHTSVKALFFNSCDWLWFKFKDFCVFVCIFAFLSNITCNIWSMWQIFSALSGNWISNLSFLMSRVNLFKMVVIFCIVYSIIYWELFKWRRRLMACSFFVICNWI